MILDRESLKNKKSDSEFTWTDLARAYWFLLGETRWLWLGLVLALFAINFYVVVPPLIIGKIVDFFTIYKTGDSLATFYIYTGILGGSFVIVSFLRLSLKNTISNLQSEVRYQTTVRGFEKLLDFSLNWHLQESAGTKSQIIRSGVEAYSLLNRRITNEIIRLVAGNIGVVAVFVFLRPPYVIFFLLYSIGFWLILLRSLKRIQKENNSYFSSIEKAGGSYVEGLSNILTIKTLGAGLDFKKHIANKEQKTKEHELSIRGLHNGLWKRFQAFNGVCYGLFLFMVGRGVVEGYISPGSLVIFYGYLQSLIGNSADMIDTYENILSAKSGIGRMMSIFWAKNSITAGTKKLPKNWGQMTVSNANFVYTGDEKTIKDLSVDIPRYTKVGVVGKTGSGKSTFAKILAGLYPISSGSYMIGGISFYDLNHDEQTRKITLVLQETEIFNFSLQDNITLMRDIDPDLLREALSVAQLDDVVDKLPDRLKTVVGEKGYHLSGGERQRVGIARAICKNSPIMIFDEATSSLDSKTERLIQEALETKLEDKTLIIIAHRVSTLRKTDIVYVFEDGKIIESGTFSGLGKDRNSRFYELYHGQKKYATI